MATKFTATVTDQELKVYINGLMHLCINRIELIGIQSWVIGDREKVYVIEFTTKTNTIESRYGDKYKWTSILKLLDRQVIWQKLE